MAVNGEKIVSLPSGQPPEPAEPSELDKIRDSLGSRFKQASDLLSAIRRPLPLLTGDDTYVDDNVPEGYWADLKALHISDISTAVDLLKIKVTGDLWDDRKYLMEKIIQVGLAAGLLNTGTF